MRFRMLAPSRVKKAKTEGSQEVLRRLEEFLENNCDEPVKILCGFWKDQQNAVTYQELRQAVIDGMIDQETLRLWSQDYSILTANRLRSLWTEAIAAGAAGQPILDRETFAFQTQTPGVLSWIDKHGAEFVTASTQEQKDAIAALLTKKIKDSHTVDELAQLIRPCIGLTERDAKAAVNLYDTIVATLTKDHPRMKPENIRKKALDATMKYAEKKHRQRAMTIAQTESAFAYNRGADEGVRQAQSEKLIGRVMKRWSTSGDDQVCGVCQSFEGMEVEMDKGFPFKGRSLFPGHNLLPPAHPRCACAVEYIEVEPPQMPYDMQGPQKADEEKEGERSEPQYLGSLDDTSDAMVKSTLERLESEIVKSDIENAIVVTKSGLIFQCYGNKNGVYPNVDLEAELMNASVTHNHPSGSLNEYSFSQDDIDLFIKYNLRLLRGIDEKYIYELSRDGTDLDSHATLEELINSDGDLARHEEVIEIARGLGIGYRRWKR